jgi:protein-S-isoprenylcysteine O-methyltransferase Ste14
VNNENDKTATANGRGFVNVPGQAWARWRVPLGYPVGLLCIFLAHPTLWSVAVGAVIALIGLLVRAAAAGHLRRAKALADTGPYARTRNPLYFGSALLAAGFLVASHSLFAAILLAAYFAVFYPTVMRREEAELRANYGDAFEEYARRVPLFLPRLGPSGGAGKMQFSFAQYIRNREYNAAIGAALILTFLSVMAVWRR